MFQLFAERAVRIGEHRHFQLAVAAHFGDGFVERQAVEIDGVEHFLALVGQAAAGFGFDQVAHQHIGAGFVGVGHGFAGGARNHHFVNALNRRGGNAFDFQVLVGIVFFQRGADGVADFGRYARADFGGSRFLGGRGAVFLGDGGRLAVGRGCFAAGGQRQHHGRNGDAQGERAFHGNGFPCDKKTAHYAQSDALLLIEFDY